MAVDDYIHVRYIRMPIACRAVTLPCDDTSFDIYINLNLPEELQERALAHELNHVRLGHFYDCNPVAQNEQEAG